MTQLDSTSAHLSCHLCGYDLRMHAHDAKCPECGGSVAEAREVAKVPIRPSWRDSDPRWRRRMIAGVWILALVPLMDVLQAFGWTERVPVPVLVDYRGNVQSLADTLVCNLYVYQPIAFCMGVVLLFARERGRRRDRLDWTRWWGVLCSYVVALLSAAQVLFIMGLVTIGIAAVFHSMPPKHEPGATRFLATVGGTYVRYGPYPTEKSMIALVAFSSITMLLACVALFDALRSIGATRRAAILLTPLATFALVHLWQLVQRPLGLSSAPPSEVARYALYFSPALPVSRLADLPNSWSSTTMLGALFMEIVKWLNVVTIAIWLTIAQIRTWRRSARSHVGRSA